MRSQLPEKYLGFTISQSEGWARDTGSWCRTTASEDRGRRAFSLTERIEGPRGAGWPDGASAVERELRRQGLGIARALLVLRSVPDGQDVSATLPDEGPRFIDPDEDLLARLILKACQNLARDFRHLGEKRVDVRGLGEILSAAPGVGEYLQERLTNRGFLEPANHDWSDGFGMLSATEAGFRLLDVKNPVIPASARGFQLSDSEALLT